jgi:hypothetical protein
VALVACNKKSLRTSGNRIPGLYFPCRCNWGIEKRPGFGEEGDMKRRSPQAIWPASSGGYPATLLASELKLGVRAFRPVLKGGHSKGRAGLGIAVRPQEPP